MGLRSFMLVCALVGGRATIALAQLVRPGIVPIFQNTSSTEPTPTSAGLSCENKCSVYYPKLSAVSWVHTSQIIYTTKITVATESVRITTGTAHTFPAVTELIYDFVPPEYDLYSLRMNEEGTAVLTLSLDLPDGVPTWSPVTYPTPYVAYSTEYHWEGALQTHDKEGTPVCATAGPELANVPLYNWPEYPAPKVQADEEDPWGWHHQAIWVPVEEQPDKQFFDLAFPKESAFLFCESIPAKPEVTMYEAAKYVTVTTTIYTAAGTLGIGIIQSTATGWEELSTTTTTTRGRPNMTPDIPRVQTTMSGFEGTPMPTAIKNPPTISFPNIPDDIRSGIVRPPTSDIVTPAPVGQPPAGNPSAPIFTLKPTVTNGRSTTVPIFILPGSPSSTATIGQTVTFNGQTTVLAAPPAVFTWITTTIGGVVQTLPAYIISGTETATIGQTVTVEDQTTVLEAPSAVYTWITTAIDGEVKTLPAYIIEGTSTATVGQTVVIDGETTVLSTPTGTEGLPGSQPTAKEFDGGADSSRMSMNAIIITFSVILVLAM